MSQNETPQTESHFEPWWCPDRFEERVEFLVQRVDMVKKLRKFFDDCGYVEVETPSLQLSPGMEPHLTAFETTIGNTLGHRQPFYLHTSPELAMKKLLAAGMNKIFQLARVFRDCEWSSKHHPEFTMLEWYTVGADWRRLAEEAISLVAYLCGPTVSYGGQVCNLDKAWEFISVQEGFKRFAGIDLLETTSDPINPNTEMLRVSAEGIGLRTHDTDTWEDIFFRIFLERVEPVLGCEVPTVLHSYPASMAALARISSADPRVAERFEIFICGLEIANGYSELTDAAEQRARFGTMVAQREAQGRPIYPVDEGFLAALKSGIPECAGLAMGFDRLVMLATGAERIIDVLWAPVGTD